ncbi:MAG TPA: S8 family serine peptidase [bacterium]
MTTCVVLLACFVMIRGAMAAPFEVRFQSGTVTPAEGVYEVPALSAQTVGADHVHALVQLADYLHAGQKQDLAAAGIELLGYLPDRAYVASVRVGLDAATAAQAGVRHISAMLPVYKLHPRVIAGELGKWSEYTNGRHVFSVDIMPDVTLEQARKELLAAGCELGNTFEAAHSVVAAFDAKNAADIAGLDAVLFINEISPPLDMVNDVTRTRLHVNEVQTTPYNLNGDSTTILVFDGGMVDSTHPAFGDRVTWNSAGAVLDHSTHVAGTVGGAGQAGGAERGMAPMARIISGSYTVATNPIFYNNPGNFESDYRRARRTFNIEETTNSIGINIEQNGYSCAWFGDYELTARTLDILTRDTEGSPLTMFFAAGNDRNGATCGLNYSSMSVPACAKNVITVGSTNTSDGISSFSCFGPTDDGRIKPEVCATGENVTSTMPGGGYGQMSGTSMATPAVAGVGLLILQRWHRMFPGAPDPMPETMKAILINSATDMGTAGVDFGTGFGLVNALKAIQNMEAGGILESELGADEDYTHSFTVGSGQSALDVSLAWSDVAALGNVIPTLVNDLDLRLVDPNGTSYLPWRLNAASPSSPAQTGVDSINVCERVHVANPAAGTWTLHVTGHLNGSETQTFGLSSNAALVAGWATVTGQLVNSAQTAFPGRVAVVNDIQLAETDSTLHYALYVPGGQSVTLHAEAYGYVPRDTTFTPVSGQNAVNIVFPTVAANGTVTGVVTNQFGAHLPGAVVSFGFPGATVAPDTTDGTGTYSASMPGAIVYHVVADYYGAKAAVDVTPTPNGTTTANITITSPQFLPAGPDAHGYYAFEEQDSGLTAQYDWLEVSPAVGGPGTTITPGTGNDWIVPVTLPFTFRYYGQDYTTASVGADGYVAFGSTTGWDSVYVNRDIPNARVPNNMICVFWDDLNPAPAPGDGDYATYYDAANSRFIIEFHYVSHYTPNTNHVTAQLILYPQTAHPTVTGDNEFQIQYQAVDYSDNNPVADADATIGIENGDGTQGIQVVFDSGYDPHCFPLRAEHALLFTTGRVAGYGTVTGHVTTVPPVADITQVAVTIGSRTVHPNASGNFVADSMFAANYIAHATIATYEVGADTFLLRPDSTVNLSFTLLRLDPPRNLTGQYAPDVREIQMTWNRPACLEGGSPLDGFTGYEIWRFNVGTPVATVTDTFYNYHVTQSGNHIFWVVGLYDGGRSDTSNHYRVAVVLGADDNTNTIPTTFYLKQNYPNPFNPTTRIEYGLPKAAPVSLDIFDILGRNVAVLSAGTQDAGVHTVSFDGTNLGSGIYYCRLRAGEFVHVQKMLLMR